MSETWIEDDGRQFAKVKLPGNGRDIISEKPWVEVQSIDDERLVGRIDNDLVLTGNHGYQFDDVVVFEWKDDWWQSVGKLQ